MLLGSAIRGSRKGRVLPVNEDRLPEENERLRDQLRMDAEALERLRIELREIRREREDERRQGEANLDAVRQRAEAAETRAAELDAVRQRADAAETRAAELDAVRQRADAAETRAAELDAELSAGVLGRLRGLCEAVRSTLQEHWPGAGRG
jgi:chromosome segregation ATPase